MPVKRRSPKLRLSAALPPAAWAFITDQPFPEGTHSIERFWLQHSMQTGHIHATDGYSVESAWRQFREDILENCIAEHPGTRPRCWWVYDAPRLNGTTLPEPRCRIGRPTASGQSTYEGPREDDARYLGGCGLMPLGGVYESQWTYLARHGLLLPSEQPLAHLAPERIPAPEIELDENGHIVRE
jgi:hypothetical protein